MVSINLDHFKIQSISSNISQSTGIHITSKGRKLILSVAHYRNLCNNLVICNLFKSFKFTRHTSSKKALTISIASQTAFTMFISKYNLHWMRSSAHKKKLSFKQIVAFDSLIRILNKASTILFETQTLVQCMLTNAQSRRFPMELWSKSVTLMWNVCFCSG